MKIINVTPDSFSDGGEFISSDQAILEIKKAIEIGTDYIDLGAESTRPGAEAVSSDEEWARLEPVFYELSKIDLNTTKISLDSRNPETMIKACATGLVHLINDVSGYQSFDVLKECIDSSSAKNITLEYCAMHMHKSPESMQENPLSSKLAIASCDTFFSSAKASLLEAGFLEDNIYLDPGIGFGKDDAANLLLINESQNWSKRFNLLYGISRKSFLGRLLDIEKPKDRDAPSKALEISLAMMGTKIIRTHDAYNLIKVRDAIC